LTRLFSFEVAIFRLHFILICFVIAPDLPRNFPVRTQVIPVLKELAAGPLKGCPNVVATINQITTALSAPNVFTEKNPMYV
jgi:hypothetical protein